MDILFVSPANPKGTYQSLSTKYSAIEPPTWALLLAESCRSKGYSVGILDMQAENLSHEEAQNKINLINPKLVSFVVYGQNVNAGTTNMSGAVNLINYLKDNKIGKSISLIGSHAQALPKETLEKEKNIVDFRGPRKKTKNLAKDKKFQLFSSIRMPKLESAMNSVRNLANSNYYKYSKEERERIMRDYRLWYKKLDEAWKNAGKIKIKFNKKNYWDE